MRPYKCAYCHLDISPDELIRIEKRDRNGEIRLNSKGQPLYANYHKRCKDFLDKEKREKDLLYDYIQQTYFYKMIPNEMYTQMALLRNGNNLFDKTHKYAGYDYDTILACLRDLEPYLLSRISNINFRDDIAKCRYIIKVLQSHIDSFSKQYELAKAQQAVQNKNNTISFIDNTIPPKISNNNIDYENIFSTS